MNKKKLYIIGNWKMNKTITEVQSFFNDFKKLLTKNNLYQIIENIDFGFAVPSVFLPFLNKNKITPNMIIAAQNIYSEKSGPYTGEISAQMVKSVGANAVIIGHSERRQHFNETNDNINKKIMLAIEDQLMPIVCVGETLLERKQNKWQIILKTQLQEAFKNINFNILKKIVIAYEPVWAIGTGISASPEQVQETCGFLRQVFKDTIFNDNTLDIIIQYGGSVNVNNIVDIIKQKDIDGVLVGGASLTASSFVKFLNLGK